MGLRLVAGAAPFVEFLISYQEKKGWEAAKS